MLDKLIFAAFRGGFALLFIGLAGWATLTLIDSVGRVFVLPPFYDQVWASRVVEVCARVEGCKSIEVVRPPVNDVYPAHVKVKGLASSEVRLRAAIRDVSPWLGFETEQVDFERVSSKGEKLQ